MAKHGARRALLRADAPDGDEWRRTSRAPDPIEVLLIERHQPCLRDPAVGDAVDADRPPDNLATAERGAAVGQLDERLVVMCLAPLGDLDRSAAQQTHKLFLKHKSERLFRIASVSDSACAGSTSSVTTAALMG